jgi:thiaminase/transcriptional activator TenA
MGAYDILHDACMPIWERAANNPMVRAIGDGSLPRETFRYYFEQNILYLREYSRATSLVVAKAPDEAAIDVLGQFLRGGAEWELPMNRNFLERLGGDPNSLTPYQMNSANYGYTRHLLAAASMGDCVEGLTAILPCPCGYNEFAKSMVHDVPDDPIYAEWIRRFGEDDEGDELLRELTRLLDRLVDPAHQALMQRLVWIFQVSSRYEVMFWDAAYNRGANDPFGGLAAGVGSSHDHHP